MPKRNLPFIEDEQIILRLLKKSDLPFTLSWRNQDQIRKWFIFSSVISEEQHYAWFDRYNELDNDFTFIILAKDLNNIPVGQISLYKIDWELHRAEYGRLMIGHEAAKGRGYAKKATRLLLDYGFKKMGLKEVYLEVKEENKIAIDIYKSTGLIEVSKKDGLIRMRIKNTDYC